MNKVDFVDSGKTNVNVNKHDNISKNYLTEEYLGVVNGITKTDTEYDPEKDQIMF